MNRDFTRYQVLPSIDVHNATTRPVSAEAATATKGMLLSLRLPLPDSKVVGNHAGWRRRATEPNRSSGV